MHCFISLILWHGKKKSVKIDPYPAELKNVNYFNQVYISFGAVTWPNEQDIAPEILVSELCTNESEYTEVKAEV